MTYENRFNDGHKHNKNKTSPKGLPQCSKCGKIIASGSDMKKLRKLQSENKSNVTKSTARTKSSVGKKSKGARTKTNRRVSRRSTHLQEITPDETESTEGRLPSRLDTAIPRGAVAQSIQKPQVLESLQTKIVQGELIKQIGKEANKDLRQAFRLVKERS